jgi:hypothetical protein
MICAYGRQCLVDGLPSVADGAVCSICLRSAQQTMFCFSFHWSSETPDVFFLPFQCMCVYAAMCLLPNGHALALWRFQCAAVMS